ncbi:MAG: restriction endonuclease subunit S [Patescibacteria group bacterium]|jgi:type I restriction enzyme S subunit
MKTLLTKKFKETELGLIPENWEIKKLEEVANFCNGYSFISKDFVGKSNDALPVFKMGNIGIGGGLKITGKEDCFPKEKAHLLDRFIAKPHDILMCMTDMKASMNLLGHSARIRGEKFLVNQRVGKITPNNNIDPLFLYFYINTNEYIERLRKTARSGVQVNLTTESIRESLILFPPLAEQRKIAEVLGALDDKIELNRKMNKTLESLGQAIFKEWFIDFENKDDWRSVKLGNFIKILSGFSFSSENFGDNGKFGLVTIKNVQDGNFVTKCTNRIKNPPSKMPLSDILQSGDIILSLTGNVGRTCLVYGRDDYLLNQRVAKLVPYDKRDYAFAYFLFRQKEFQDFLIAISKGTAQQNLSPIETASVDLELPSDDALEEFGTIANPIMQKLVDNMNQIETLSQIRDSFLPHLMSGKLRII